MTKTAINLVFLMVFTLVLVGCLSSGSETVTSPISNNVVSTENASITTTTLDQLFSNNAENNPSYIPAAPPIAHAPANFKAPSKIDWTQFATPVRNQSIYPVCTAFASIAAIEAQENIDNNMKKALDYSELDLFYRSKGKSATYYKTGGLISWCLDSAKAFNGYCRETDAPYSQIPKTPTYTTKIPLCHKIKSYTGFNGADNMKYYLQKGPIVSSMVYYRDLNYYRSGVYSPNTTVSAGGHAVCVVGYNDAEKCWIIKNSWGTSWGNSGYFKLAYGAAKIEQYQSYSVTTK